MNAGVSNVPCRVSTRPPRACVCGSVAVSSNLSGAVIPPDHGATPQKSQARYRSSSEPRVIRSSVKRLDEQRHAHKDQAEMDVDQEGAAAETAVDGTAER